VNTLAVAAVMIVALLAGMAGCASAHGSRASGAPGGASLGRLRQETIERVLAADPARFARFTLDPAKYRLQILAAEVVPRAGGRSEVVRSGYRLDAEYFYPASTIKLCAAVAALQEFERLRDRTRTEEPGLATPWRIHPLFDGQRLEERDDTNLSGGTITLGHEVRKLFLVSDNPAYNRLYEFVGQRELNERMWALGLGSTRLTHRLAAGRSPEENRRTPRIELLGRRGVVEIPEKTSTLAVDNAGVAGLLVGRGFMRSGQVVPEPMDFTRMNRMSLRDLQDLLVMVCRPDVDPRLDLSDADRLFLLDAMAGYPAESTNPVYDRATYPDDWGKFLLPGLLRVAPKEDLRISNKIGLAYGFLTENAYVVHIPTGRSFFIAATIYVNEAEILNTDNYEYNSVGLPFLAELGEALARELWDMPRE
jgi:hypothetical protein